MTSRPGWLTEKITATQRAAKPSTCPTCGAPVLAGLDADLLAAPAITNPDPVEYLEAVHAFLTGRHVYKLINGELCWTDDTDLSKNPPGRILLVQHSCPENSQPEQLMIEEAS